MAAKSPTLSIKTREIIGVDQFSQRREVFDKFDTVFLPPLSPTNVAPAYKEVDPVVMSNHGKTTANFKRNTTGTSSMRESKTEEPSFEFRTRKYSDNFTSELNQSDDVDYRRSMTERTRRLSKLRRDFLNSNLHEPGINSPPFNRVGTRASLPARSLSSNYKIESPNLFKFSFAEPYSTPPPVRKLTVDVEPTEIDGKENEDPQSKANHKSLPAKHSGDKIDHQKLFEELVKRYSPERKPIDWRIPPTRPKVVGSVPKSTSSMAESVGSMDSKKTNDDEVFQTKEEGNKVLENNQQKLEEDIKHNQIVHNGPQIVIKEIEGSVQERNSKNSLSDVEEKRDVVPELTPIQNRTNKEPARKPSHEAIDMTIPDLINKMIHEGEDLEKHKHSGKKVKRKRSFLDKLLGRKKDK